MDNTRTPLTIAQKAKKIAQHTAVLFSVGNVPIYAEAFEVLNVSHEAVIGLTASVAAAAAVIGTRVIEVMKEKDIGLPFFTLAACNTVSAGAAFYAAAQKSFEGFSPFSSSDLRMQIGLAMGFAFWSAANFSAGWRQRHPEANIRCTLKDTTLWSVGDVFATEVFSKASVAGWLALARSMTERPEDRTREVKKPSDFSIKHITSERLLLLSYLTAGIGLLSTKPLVASGFLMFSAGYYFLKNDLNPEFLADARRAFQSAPRVNF